MVTNRGDLGHDVGGAPTGDGTDPKPSDGVVITPMRRRHLRAVTSIENQTNHRPWSLGLFLGELRMPTSRCYVVALERHQVLGFAGLMVTGDEGHITNIAVHPDHRRRQLASRMLLALFSDAVLRGVNDLTLEVRHSNDGAQELYRRFGFAPGGIRKNYYADIGEDAVIMWAHNIDSQASVNRLQAVSAGLRHRLVVDRSRTATEPTTGGSVG